MSSMTVAKPTNSSKEDRPQTVEAADNRPKTTGGKPAENDRQDSHAGTGRDHGKRQGNTKAQAGPVVAVRNDLVAMLHRAQEGDTTTLPAVREALKDQGLVDAVGGDLARLARTTLLEKFAGKNLLVKEAIVRKVELLIAEVAGPTPTPLERLLADRIATCWLHLHHLEQVCSQKESLSLELATYYQKSFDRAQKRYLSAIKMLAVIRKLALPVLQVNIAKKQINVAGNT